MKTGDSGLGAYCLRRIDLRIGLGRGMSVRHRGATPRPQTPAGTLSAVSQPLAVQLLMAPVRVCWQCLRNPLWWVKFVALGLVLLTMAVAYQLGRQVLESPLRAVTIEGDYQYLDPEGVSGLFDPLLGEYFASLPLQQLRVELEALPWIVSAALQRDWPDTLLIALQEQQPVARWGEAELMNRDGELFRPERTAHLDELPYLQGPVGVHVEVMAQFEKLDAILGARGLSLAALELSERGAWTTRLHNGVKLVLGRHRLVEKLQRFLALYDRQLEQYMADIRRVDLRYKNGIAVRWRNGVGPGEAGERDALTTKGKE